jgi:hypothetical protein
MRSMAYKASFKIISVTIVKCELARNSAFRRMLATLAKLGTGNGVAVEKTPTKLRI